MHKMLLLFCCKSERFGFSWQILLMLIGYFSVNVVGEIEQNSINEDGSFSFRHSSDDIGGYYHSASGSPDNIVRGRYGSRNPTTGQVEETVYTAGPRGFRVNGPKIHRKMDLAQYPTRPIGSPDDPLADPYDDPSYSFNFRTSDQSRTETSDATGRVRGLYSYIDDVGERHSVRYAAGAGTGFEVLNAVPDNPINVEYTAPLYKAHPKTRGKMTTQRGPDGSYKLIAAGPDHRRAESRDPDGLVRGTYSFLDDKGVQRTVEYIAGAGIGYRVVKNRMGPGTHINPSVTDFRLSDTDFKLANDYGRGAGSAGGGGSVADDRGSSGGTGGGRRGGGSSDGGDYLKTSGRGKITHKDDNKLDSGDDHEHSQGAGRNDDVSSPRKVGGTSESRLKSDRMGKPAGGRGGTRYQGTASSSNNYDGDSRVSTNTRNRDRGSSNRNRVNDDRSRVSAGTGGRNEDYDDGDGYKYSPPSSNNYHFNDDDVGSLPPLITANRKILETDRERDWVDRHRDSTVIKNVGKWYIGLPPGQSVRAHVQNIDVLPLGGRRGSPSEALRQDELADMVASLEKGGRPS